VTAEAAKLGAFLRRDVLIALSYRAAFVGEALQLAMQIVLFALFAKLVDPSTLPAYGGTHAGYLEFVVVGSTLTFMTGLLLHRVATAIRQEQMIGTLEALLVTPTRMATLQAGSVALDALQLPVRMGGLIAIVAVVFGLDLHPSGVVPAVVVLVAFAPFVWGLGLVSAGAMITFRRGGRALTALVTGLGIVSGAYFPLTVLPGWIETIARENPLAIAIETIRDALIGGVGWGAIDAHALLLVPLSAASLVLGSVAFRAAIARERRRGTLGLY